MTVALHLDHDFPWEPTHDQPAPDFTLAGEIDGAPVYRCNTTPTSVGSARLPTPVAAVLPAGDPTRSPSRPPAGHSEAALVLGGEITEWRTRCELLGQLVDLLTPSGIWKSFFLGFMRRHRVDRVEDLTAEVLHTLLEQAYQVAAARPARGDR